MARALALAERGRYRAAPNPVVGCVIANQGRIVGEGWHQQAGEPHAEINALRAAGDHARGSWVYVTLEPCAHHGRTPPCADALIAAAPAGVVAAMVDPNPKVAGAGLERLRSAGIQTRVGLMEDEARALNPGFCKRMTTGRPLVRVKLAASLDGRTALADGTSRWITGDEARADVHRWRARSSAIITGRGTVAADDPRLTARLPDQTLTPLRVVLDSARRTSPAARVFSGPGHALLAGTTPPTAAYDETVEQIRLESGGSGGVDVAALLDMLGDREHNEVMVEAGPAVAGSFLAAGLADELLLYVGSSLLGPQGRPLVELPAPARMSARQRFLLLDSVTLGNDVRLRYRPASAD